VEVVRATAAALRQRCQVLAEATDVDATAPSPSTGIDSQLRAAGELLDAVDAAVVAQRRRSHLEAEDAQLGSQEKSYQVFAEQARRSADAVNALDQRLRQVIESAGLPKFDSPLQAVEAFRAAADACRRRQAGLRALAEIDQRMRALGDDDVLQRLDEDLVTELHARGGQAADAEAVALPDAAALRRLDIDAEHARQGWHSVSEQAREARARLEGSLQHVPSVADLEDERDACAGIRARSLQRLAALQRATALIDEASRVTHRDLAPQLAQWVGSRLTLLTDSRYVDVNVDTEHFAISLLGRERPDMVPLEHASHGTRDQVSLLLRLALCETMSGSGERVPLLLDEPMLTADPRRREILAEFLQRLSETHQVVLTTADPEVGDVVQRAAGDGCAVVTVNGSDGVVRTPKLVEKVGRHTARVRVV
jgi:DNA repair exonuclease SbcCD ATPase subunit